jgi:hypothetical protein
LNASGTSTPVAGSDGYVYDNPVNPESDPEVVQFINRPQRYAVISQPPNATYTATQTWQDEGQNLCPSLLTCATACKPPIVSGTCDSSCNINLTNGQSCPKYGGNTSFTVNTNGSTSSVNWGDGGTSSAVPPPNDYPLAHRYSNPGNYDVIVNCGLQQCIKRYQVVCQNGGSPGNTPTPLPTASPTPTGVYLCVTPLVCSHPCGCNNTSLPYAAAGCTISSSAATNVNGAFSNSVGSGSGQACMPGMICCQPPSSTSAWFKTKNASYHEKGPLSNPIPTNAVAFDSSDTGPCSGASNTYNCHTINSSGVLTAEGTINLSQGVSNFPRWSYGNSNYNFLGEFTPDTFIQYMKARKNTVTITDPEDVQTNKVNYISGGQVVYEIDNNGMQGKAPFLLLIDNGDLTFDLSNKFNPTNGAMAIIVDGTINIKSTMSEMNGIFIANRFDFAYDIAQGSYTSQELLVNGNIIALNDVDCLAKRRRTLATKPTCFFTFDFVNQYVPLWSLFSTRTFSRSSS